MNDRPKLRGALIGCGFVSRYHLEAWRLTDDASIVALCDIDPVRLAEAGTRIPQASRFPSASAMFRETELDFVEICTRPESHLALVELAADHGVHVLCQKPSALNRADLLAMISACERSGLRFMVHENWRFRPWLRAIKREVDQGTVGKPIRLRISHRDTRAIRPDGFRDQPYFASMPRLILFEMGPHLIDSARYLFGEVVEVSAKLGRFGQGHVGEDLAMLTLEFETGALGLLDLSWCSQADLARPEWALNETVVEGSEAILRLQVDGSLVRVGHDHSRRVIETPLPDDAAVYLDGYVQTQKHFIDGIRNGSPHETDGLDNLRTMSVSWAAYEAARQGRTLRLSPLDGEFDKSGLLLDREGLKS